MATKPTSMFGAEAAKRQIEQETLEAKLKHEPAAQEDNDDQIIRMNISITKGYHKKLMAYSKKRCLPASALIRMWIDEHCD